MKENKVERRRKDPSMYATVDKVLDHNSLHILESLQKRNKMFNLGKAIATGKEAVVYPAEIVRNLETKFITKTEEEEEFVGFNNNLDSDLNNENIKCVVKIFKTSTMCFKDRSKYIKNEVRYNNICTTNSRKLIKVWAEKEVRNLKRMKKAGMNVPTPLYLKKNVLILEMITRNNDIAPILKNHNNFTKKLYDDVIQTIVDMYKKAKLVHADLSEYNILVSDNDKLFAIDVGQSVDLTHENALHFLVVDILNVNAFFRNKNVEVEDENKIFEKVTGLKIPSYLKDGKLNKNSFIPTGLMDIANEEDAELFLCDSEVEGCEVKPSSETSNDLISEEEENVTVEEIINNNSNLNFINNELSLTSLHKNIARHKHKKEVKEANRERRKNRVEKKKAYAK